jgi:SAM-dependent methyltransferase
MNDWAGGYVTDISYLSGFYANQSPSLMALAALLNGIAARPIRRDESYHLCDVGCGVGVTALITAAANPAWHVTGLDFHPGHIAAARRLARDAGVENVTFLEVDLRDFALTPECRALEPFDAVTSHGVWSWVEDSVQDGIVALLNAKLKPGGLFHLSYNLLTAWQYTLGLQRLIREAGLRLASRSDRQAIAGLQVAKALEEAGPMVCYSYGNGKQMIAKLAEFPQAYVAHEMMNANWRPVMHGDVAARLAAAKLEFAGSVRLLNNFPQLVLAESQRIVLDKFDDPLMLELFKDICRPQLLRNDVFVRGGQRIDPIARDMALNDIVLALNTQEANWVFEFEAADGKAQMSEPYYRTVFNRLKRGPAKVAELLALPDLQGRRDNPAELIGVAVGTDQAIVVPNPGVTMDTTCARLNDVLLRAQFAAGNGGGPIHFALPAIGHGITLPNFEGMIVHELANHPEDVDDPRNMAARLAIQNPPEVRAELAERLERFFANEAPMLRHFGFSL